MKINERGREKKKDTTKGDAITCNNIIKEKRQKRGEAAESERKQEMRKTEKKGNTHGRKNYETCKMLQE